MRKTNLEMIRGDTLSFGLEIEYSHFHGRAVNPQKLETAVLTVKKDYDDDTPVIRKELDKGITYEKTEHPAVFSMKEVPAVELPHPEADAKNLFVRDDKKRNYFLITVRGDKRVDLKAFAKDHGTRRLSFASAEDLMEMLGVAPGSVSPFGILNDEERKVKVFLDQDFWKDAGLIGVHPNENTATVWLQAEEMAEILREHGNEVEKVEL